MSVCVPPRTLENSMNARSARSGGVSPSISIARCSSVAARSSDTP
jgi:hypothetical protein